MFRQTNIAAAGGVQGKIRCLMSEQRIATRRGGRKSQCGKRTDESPSPGWAQ
jgi:hypothetical protein